MTSNHRRSEREKTELAYTYNRVLKDVAIDDAELLVRDALAEKGFGVLTEIDVKATMKKKLDVNFRPYMILGACNPEFAYKAFQSEDKIGTMLPCNLVLQDAGDGTVEVSAIDPMASMQAIENPDLEAIANDVQGLLKSVIEEL